MICDLKEHQELTITSKDCDDSGSSDEHSIYIGSNASETENLESDGEEERFDVSKSPQKLNGRNYKLYNGNSECKVVTIESLDNPYVVPLIMNCQEDNPAMISKAVPIGYQDNGTFVLDIDALQHRKDLYSDENGSWAMTGCKAKFYTIIRDEEGKVTELEKVNTQTSSDVVVKRRTYTCSSYTSYHKTIVSIEFGKDIEKWFPLYKSMVSHLLEYATYSIEREHQA
ncbi:unnamed protein product [Porites lobata]|uniref:Uncharacterized protein n=1 Tax=Porites lobata TaxID=104759 RepID=A0ABN8NSY6_9CNID|nr:unnamed protein product [Porites lobata]